MLWKWIFLKVWAKLCSLNSDVYGSNYTVHVLVNPNKCLFAVNYMNKTFPKAGLSCCEYTTACHIPCTNDNLAFSYWFHMDSPCHTTHRTKTEHNFTFDVITSVTCSINPLTSNAPVCARTRLHCFKKLQLSQSREHCLNYQL